MSSQHSISIGEHLTRVGQRYDEHKQLLRRQHELAERRAAPFTPLITRFAERARRRSQSRPLTEWTNTLEPPPMSEWARVSDEKGCRAGHEAVHRETHHTLRTGENAPIGDRLYNLAMRHASREPRQSTPSRLEDASMAARTDHIPHVTRRAHELVRDGHVVSSSERWRQQREVNRALAVAAARVAEMREVRDTPQITAFATRRRRRGATASTPTAATSTASARTTSRGGAQTRWRTRLQERSVSLGHRTSGGSRGQGTKAAHTAPLFVSTKGRHEDRKAHLGEERAKKTEEEEQQQQQQQQPATGSPPRRRPPPPHTLFSGRRLRPECAVSHRAGHRSASGCDGRSANSTVRIGTRAATTRAADDDTRRAPNAAQKPSRDNGQSSRQETDAPGGTGGRRCRGGARQSWTDWPVPYSSQKNEASVHVDSCAAAAAAAAAADGANSLAIEACEETDDRTPACTPPHVDRADEPSVSRCVTPPPPPPPPPPRVCESPGMSGRAVAVSRGATTTPGARGGNGIVCVEEAHTTRARVSRETVRESPSTRLHRHGRVSQDKTDPTSDTSATYRPCINPTSEMLWRRRVRLLAAPHRIAPRRAAAAAAAAVGTSRQDGDSAEDAAHESNADTVYVMADDEEEEEEDDDDVYRGRRRGAAVSVAQELLWREAEKKREARVQRAHDAQRVAERQSCTFHPCVSGRQSRPRLRGDDWTPPHTQQQHPHPHSHLQTQQQQQQQQHKQQTQPTSGAWGKETCRRRVGLSFDARAAVWQSQRSRRLRSLADELEQAELAECTFQPRIQHYFPLPNQPLMRHSTGNNAHEDGKVRRTRSSSSSGGGHHHLGDVYCSHDAPSLANQSQNNVNIRHSYSGNDDEYIHACDENYDVGAYEDGLETSQAPHAKASDAKRNSRADGLSGVWAHVRRLRAAQQQRAEDALWWLPRKQRARASHVTLAHNDVNQLVYGRGHAVKPVSRQQSLLCLSSRSTCPSVRVVTSYDAMGGNPVEEDAVGPGSFCSNRVARRQLDTPSSWKSEEEDRDGAMTENIHVLVRVRPSLPHEPYVPPSALHRDDAAYLAMHENEIVVDGRHYFSFDTVLDMDCTSEHISRVVCDTLVRTFLDGVNASALTYGQTGAGKTHTMNALTHDVITRLFDALPSLSAPPPCSAETSSVIAVAAAAATENRSGTAAQHVPLSQPSASASSLVSPLSCSSSLLSPTSTPAPAYVLLASVLEVYQEHVYDLLAAAVQHPGQSHNRATSSTPVSGSTATAYHLHPSASTMHTDGNNHSSSMHLSSSNINVHTSTTSHNHNNNCASNTNSSLGGMSSKSSGSGLRLRLREDPTHGVYVCGLTEHPVQSAEELHRLVRCATASRATAATMNNATSSRSHCVVTLTLHNRGTSSRLFLVDLAGSERLKKLTTGLPSASCSVSLPAGQQRQPRRVGGADGGDMPSTQVPPYRNNPGSDNSHNHCSSNRYEMHVRSFGSDELIDTMSNETCLVSPAAHASCAVNRNSSRFHSPTRAHTCSLSKHTSNSNPCEGVGASVHSHSNGTGSSSSSHFARRVSRDEFAREYRDARLREGISVNSGLLALGNVIHSLYAHKAHIPFRSSVLTRILQPSLAGHGRTVMLACISPHDSDRAETISTLKYAHRVKSLKTTPRVAVSSFRSSEQVQQTITALRQEMAELHRQLATLMAVCSLQQQQKQKQKEASSRSVSVAALSSSALLCPMVTPASPTTSHTLHHADPRDSRNNTIDASTYTHTHKGYVAADGNRNTDPANDNNEEGKEESMRAQRADSYLSLAPTTFDNSSADHSRGCRMPYMAHKVTATASVSPASATVAPLLTECVTEPPAHVAQPILARQQQQQSGSQIEPGERARPHSPSLTCTPQASQQYTSVLEQLLEQERTTTRRLEEELFRAEYAAMVELEKRRTFEQRVRELERSVGAPAETATKTNTDNHSTGNNDADATTPTSPTTYGTIAMANGVDDNPCTATHVDTDKTREGLLHESSTAALVKGAVRADLRAAPALRDGRRESPRHRTSPASVGMHRGTSSARRDTSRTTGNATLRYGHTNSSRVRSNSHYTDSSLHMQSPIGARRLRSSSALSAKAAAAEEKVEVGRNARATGSPAQRRRSSSGLCNIRRTERNEARPSCSFASSSSASAAGEAKRSVLKSSASKAPPSSCASTSSLLMASSQACAQGESARQPLLRSLTRSSSASLYARDTVNHEKTNTPHAMAVAPDEAHPWNRKDCPNSAAQVCASTHTGPYTRAAVGQKRSTSTIDATVQAFAVSAALDDGSSANNQWEASHSTHANKHNNNSSNHKEVNECMSLSIDSLHATETPQRGQEVVKKSPMFASLLLPVQLPSYYHRQHNDGGDDSHNTHGGIGTHDTTSRMTGAMTTTTTATTAAAVVAASSNANASPPMLERTARKDNSRVSPGRRTSCAMDAGSAARSHSNSIRSRSRSSNSPCPSSRKSHNSHQGRSCSVVAARRVGSARQTRSTRRRSVSSMCGASRDGMDVYSQSAERAGGGGGGEGEGDLTTPARAAAAVPTATRTLDCTTTTPGTHQSLPVSTTPHRQSRGRRTATSSVMDGDASCLGSMHARSASAADRVEQNRRVCQMSSELMTTPSQQHNCAEKRHGVSPTARHATDTQKRLTSSIFVPSMLTSPAPADSVGATVAIAPTPGRVDVAVFGKERPHEVRVATMHETLCGTTSSSNSSNSSVMHRCNDGSEDEHENEVEAGETCANRGDVILCDAKPMALAMQLPTTRATAGSEMDMQQDAQERKDIIDEEPHHVVDLEAASEAAAAAAAAAMRETIVVTVLPSGESLPGLLPQADDEEEEHAMCALSRLERELQELTGYRRVLCRLSGENAVRWRQMREALQQRRATLQLLLQASPLGERARAEREKELAELQEKLQPLESMDSLLLRTPGQLRELDTRLAELHSLREHQLRKIELHQGREQTRVQTEDGLGSREALLADGPTREGMSSSNNNSKNEDNNNTSDNKSKNCFCSNILNCSASNSIRTIRSYNSNASIHTSISSSSRSSTAVSGNVSSHICDFNDVNSCATATRSSRSNNMRHIRDKDARVPNETSTSATGIGNSEANASQVAAAAATTVRCGGVQPYGPRSTTLPSSRSNVSRNVNTRTAALHSVSCSTSVVNSKKLAVASAAAESRMAGSSSSRAHVLQEKKQAVSQSFRRSVTARTPSATAMMSQRSRTATNTSAVVNTTTPSAAAATEVGKTLFTRSKTLLTAQQQLLRGGKNKSLNAVV